MNDEFRTGIKRLRDIYNYLTEDEPTPDEEEESKQELISLLENLIMHIDPDDIEDNLEVIKTTLQMVKEWDTLEFWFKEKPDLVTKIKLLLNRFLIQHAEPEHSSPMISKPSAPNGVDEELSEQLAAALERALKNLPPDEDVTKVIQSVTARVTENYMKTSSSDDNAMKLSSEPIVKESNYSRLQSDIRTASGSEEAMTQTAAKVKIRKEDIMKSVLEQAKIKISQATDSTTTAKLSAPKIIIPKVTRPKQKIVPYIDQTDQLTESEQKYQELESIPPIQPQETSKQIPKLKVGAFKKDETTTPKIKTHGSVVSHQPIRPKIIVKPSIQTNESEQKSPIQEVAPPSQSKMTKPKIKLQALSVSKPAPELESPKPDTLPLKFNIVTPTEPSVKDTQINLFETFTKHNNKDKKQKTKKKTPKNIAEEESKPSKSLPLEELDFSEQKIPYEQMDKTQLYQELIALEGKKYAIEKSRKDYKSKHQKGLISNGNYAAQLDRFKYDLNYISKKINEIRQRIQSL
ncbi:MAG: hypothetical protein JW776_00830 [Candidatus Lokiarchaeota archaeon]|nr:hypothetical protein [Candidatus Lokiarchaeota archaeon]